jgi:hypothetical protein
MRSSRVFLFALLIALAFAFPSLATSDENMKT